MSPSTDRRWLALIILNLGTLMIVLDATIVNVALPSIRDDLGFTVTLWPGSSTPTCSPSAASCCSADGWVTCSATGSS